MNQAIKPHKVLRRHFEKLKEQNGAFSLRALAAKVEVSHAFLSRLMNGKAKLPKGLVERLILHLKIDPIDASNLRLGLGLAQTELSFTTADGHDTSEYKNLHEAQLELMRKWWNLAILDLLTCDFGVPLTRENIHLFLPISRMDVAKSLDELTRIGLVRENADGLAKETEKMRLPARGPSEHTRAFYLQTLRLAAKELNNEDPGAYQRRLILGFTCAVNSEKIPLAKRKLAAALRECAETLADGPCDEVFIVQGQMFSVLKT